MDKADRIIKINEAIYKIHPELLSEGIYDWAGEKIASLFGADSSELSRKKSPEEIRAEIDRQRSMTSDQRRAEQDKELDRLSNVESNIAKTETGVRVARDATLTGMQILAPGVGTALATGVRAGTAGAMAASGDTEGAKNELVSGAIDVAAAGVVGVAAKGIGAATKLGGKALGIGGKAAVETGEAATKTAAKAVTSTGTAATGAAGVAKNLASKTSMTAAEKTAALHAAGASRSLTRNVATSATMDRIAATSGKATGMGIMSKLGGLFGRGAAKTGTTGVATGVGAGAAKAGLGASLKGGLKTAAIWYAMNKILGGGSGGSNATLKPAKGIGSAATSQDYGSMQGSGNEQERDANAYQERINKARGASSVATPAYA